MDTGHYNCRDYYVSPDSAPKTLSSVDHLSVHRHESFAELERRSRSPASFKPKFPLLKLPLELRQQIFGYLLPRTYESHDPDPLASHARNFSAVQKRGARGMDIPQPNLIRKGPSRIVWRRGNIHLFSVCEQLHEECASMVYGGNTFLLFVTYSGVTFRYHWLLPSGLAPQQRCDFLECLPAKYLAMVKRVVVHVEHVDSYTGMIKFNVSGSGLVHGLCKQIQRLVRVLQPLPTVNDGNENLDLSTISHAGCERRLARVTIRVSNGSQGLDRTSRDSAGPRDGNMNASKSLEEALSYFGHLRGVHEVIVSGAINNHFARELERNMMSLERPETMATGMMRAFNDLDLKPLPLLCVYGNDMM